MRRAIRNEVRYFESEELPSSRNTPVPVASRMTSSEEISLSPSPTGGGVPIAVLHGVGGCAIGIDA